MVINIVSEIQRIYDAVPEEKLEGWEKNYRRNKEVVYVVVYRDIGFAELYLVGIILSIAVFVHPAYRGRGFGKKLVAACQDYARKKREPIEWYARADNEKSQRLARACGFRYVWYLSNDEMKTYIWEN